MSVVVGKFWNFGFSWISLTTSIFYHKLQQLSSFWLYWKILEIQFALTILARFQQNPSQILEFLKIKTKIQKIPNPNPKIPQIPVYKARIWQIWLHSIFTHNKGIFHQILPQPHITFHARHPPITLHKKLNGNITSYHQNPYFIKYLRQQYCINPMFIVIILKSFPTRTIRSYPRATRMA